MSNINFVITQQGILAMQDAKNQQVKLALSSIGLGDGVYTQLPTGEEQEMQNQFAVNGVSAGGVDIESNVIRFTVIMSHSAERPVSEIGLYTADGVLFALAATLEGHFFTLYPSIDYVATMGLSLKSMDNADTVELVSDGSGGIAIEIMQAHTVEPNPHPQYRQHTDQVMADHLAELNPHPQYLLTVDFEVVRREIEQKIERIYQLTGYLFPPLLRAEFGNGPSLFINRRLGVSYSLASRGIVALMCPENQHEGWTVKREENAIEVKVFDRSGSNRVDYSGRQNALLIDTDRVLLKERFLQPSNQMAYEIKSGVFQPNEVLEIMKSDTESLSYTSDDLVVLVCPEGQHEGWTITRSEAKLSIAVFDRSGTSRIAHNGRVNWALMRANDVPLQRDAYPFNLINGVSSTGSFMIPSPDGMDFSQSNFMPIITPEGQHEGWTIKRTNAGFQVDVFNRSGTNRVGYTGKVNWAVFQTSQSSLRSIFEVGTHKFTFKAGASYRIIAVAGGGAGGNAIRYHSGATALAGETGKDTTVMVGGLVLTLRGGEGATRGCWNNGSAYRDGKSGVGGSFEYSNTDSNITALSVSGQNGESGTMQQYDVGAGGTAYYGVEYERGAGGKGKFGSGSRQLGFGGSGGGAGSAIATFTIAEDAQDIQAMINVGAGGKPFDDPTEYYQSQFNYGFGEAGQGGIVIIEEFLN